MRTSSKQKYINTNNEKLKNRKNQNVSKSPARQRQNNINQYAVIEQAKRDFHKIETSNYNSNKRQLEKNTKEILSSKNSKNCEYENSKDFDKDNENRPMAFKNCNLKYESAEGTGLNNKPSYKSNQILIINI